MSTYQFSHTVAMSARVVVLFVLVSHMLVSKCVIVNKINIGESKLELSPLLVSAGLDDIILLSAPAVDSNTLYYLNKPNGDVEELKLNMSHVLTDYKLSPQDDGYSNIALKILKEEPKAIINPINKYRIFNLNYPLNYFDSHHYLKEKENVLRSNDFVIGPLDESDHGNWVLSAYYKGNDGEWIEMFQVITIEIIVTIPIYPAAPSLYPGEDLNLRFAYPLQHLESCEIIAPRSTFDRFYDRDMIHFDSCGFCVPNVTRADEGMWKIIGVGKIIYEATIFLRIKNNVT